MLKKRFQKLNKLINSRLVKAAFLYAISAEFYISNCSLYYKFLSNKVDIINYISIRYDKRNFEEKGETNL